MKLTALTSSLPQSLPEAINAIAELGFQWIDVPPAAAEEPNGRLVTRRGLRVGCVGLERNPTGPVDLVAETPTRRDAAVAYLSRCVEATRALGAPACYLTPPIADDAVTRDRWIDAVVELAGRAAECDVDLCLEHFPGRLIPTVRSTLQLLDQIDHPRLKLLIDIGHCLISNEDAAQAARDAGPRLGYLHLDDNDGQSDLHWPLLTGRLTEAALEGFLDAARETGYQRGVCLELHPDLEDPLGNLRRSRELLLTRWEF